MQKKKSIKNRKFSMKKKRREKMKEKRRGAFQTRAIIDVTHSLAIFYGRKPVVYVISTAAAVPKWATQPTFSFPVILKFVWIGHVGPHHLRLLR